MPFFFCKDVAMVRSYAAQGGEGLRALKMEGWKKSLDAARMRSLEPAGLAVLAPCSEQG